MSWFRILHLHRRYKVLAVLVGICGTGAKQQDSRHDEMATSAIRANVEKIS
ncbi:MAG: hypothetical protein V3S33_05540 [Gammaproteobacteria bacterium]